MRLSRLVASLDFGEAAFYLHRHAIQHRDACARLIVFERPVEAADGDFLLLVRRPDLSRETLRMPLASMSKVTSTCGMPRGAGGIPIKWNLPSFRLSRARGRSPWKNMDLDGSLVIGCGRENFRLTSWDRGVASDGGVVHHAAVSFHAE